jgi:hypothetical protein
VNWKSLNSSNIQGPLDYWEDLLIEERISNVIGILPMSKFDMPDDMYVFEDSENVHIYGKLAHIFVDIDLNY